MNTIKEIRSKSSRKEINSYKVKYDNGIFEFGFGKFDSDDGKLKIHTEFDLKEEEFKVYFSSILTAIAEYNEKTGEDFIKKYLIEDD